ncbi:MAG: hemerythrin domain-containing protein [Caulobacter sp.]|nr:hemerythrin domain-containing protein [Caulobacter sp.]
MPAARPDAIALLEADHRRMEALFADYGAARGSGRKRLLIVDICTELTLHAILEEEVLIPVCRGRLEPSVLDDLDEDLDLTAGLVGDMLGWGPDDPLFDGRVQRLRAHVLQHIREEESPDGLFARIRRSGIDLVKLGDRLLARRQVLAGEMADEGRLSPEPRSFRPDHENEDSSGDEAGLGGTTPRESRTLM